MIKKVKKLLKTRLKYLVFTLLAIVFIAITPVEVHAEEFDNAKTFYDKNASKVVFHNGYFYYAVSGRKASTSTTTVYATIGLQMRISNSAGTAVVKFKLGGGSMINVSKIKSGSYNIICFVSRLAV